MARLYLFDSLTVAKKRHQDLKRLGWRPFSIFFHEGQKQWAFWTA